MNKFLLYVFLPMKLEFLIGSKNGKIKLQIGAFFVVTFYGEKYNWEGFYLVLIKIIHFYKNFNFSDYVNFSLLDEISFIFLLIFL